MERQGKTRKDTGGNGGRGEPGEVVDLVGMPGVVYPLAGHARAGSRGGGTTRGGGRGHVCGVPGQRYPTHAGADRPMRGEDGEGKEVGKQCEFCEVSGVLGG